MSPYNRANGLKELSLFDGQKHDICFCGIQVHMIPGRKNNSEPGKIATKAGVSFGILGEEELVKETKLQEWVKRFI